MRGLMQPNLRCEVDYSEAAKELSNLWHKWHSNKSAGTRAFKLDVNDQDECCTALHIFSYAAK